MASTKKVVAIFFGGKSSEHEVSVRSGKNVCAALDRNQFSPVLIGISKQGSWYKFSSEKIFDQIEALSDHNLPTDAEPVSLICEKGKSFLFSLKNFSRENLDVAFPVLHGTLGEDGSMQGLFQCMNLPYVGCGVLSSAAGMDKEVMKRLLQVAEIPTAKYILLTKQAKHSFDYLVQHLGLPFFIKPANSGSSVGVHKIKTEIEFAEKLADAFKFDHKVLAEEFMQGREIEISVMGLNRSSKASLPGEVTATHDFYSYEAKYLDENGASFKIPAELTSQQITEIQKLANKTYQVMGCDGLTRVDFFLTKDSKFYVNEINTLPGFTKISMYPKMWEATGLSYQNLISQLLELAFAKAKENAEISTNKD